MHHLHEKQKKLLFPWNMKISKAMHAAKMLIGWFLFILYGIKENTTFVYNNAISLLKQHVVLNCVSHENVFF